MFTEQPLRSGSNGPVSAVKSVQEASSLSADSSQPHLTPPNAAHDHDADASSSTARSTEDAPTPPTPADTQESEQTTASGVADTRPVSSAAYSEVLSALFDGRPVLRDAPHVSLLGEDPFLLDERPPASAAAPEAAPKPSRTPSLGSITSCAALSASVRDFNRRMAERDVARTRGRFPHAAFAFTEFICPVSGEDAVEYAAALMAESIRQDDRREKERAAAAGVPWAQTNFIVSAGVRGCGALTQALAYRLGDLPYSLSNWYPDGSVGDYRVDRCRGVGGPGWVYLNGVPRGSRVAVVLDAVRTGVTAARLVEGVLAVPGCSVVGVYTVATMVLWRAPRPSAAAAAPAADGASATAPPAAASPAPDDTAVPPLRSLYYVSVSGEQTHVLTTAECAVAMEACEHVRGVGEPASTLLGHLGPATSRSVNVRTSLRDAMPLQCAGVPRRLPASAMALIKKMPRAEVEEKLRRVTATFTDVPIVENPEVGGYPYCFFSLTDFQPALRPSLVEDMADLAVYFADLARCTVLVSEGDRGGGPLLQAVSLRTHLPFIIASWSLPAAAAEPVPSAATASSGVVSVGFGGANCELSVSGLPHSARCGFIDDMLSSGGTAEAVLRCIAQLGATTVEAVFASEKLYPRAGGGIAVRKGCDRLAGIFPETRLTCLAQFVASGTQTAAPPCRVGEW